MTFTENANRIFNQAIADYHIKDNIDTPINNPFAEVPSRTVSTSSAGLIPYSGISRISSAIRRLILLKRSS